MRQEPRTFNIIFHGKLWVIPTIILLLIIACNSISDSNSIVGRWKGPATENGIMVFHANGKMEMLDSIGMTIFDETPAPIITWESIDEVTPRQIYITMEAGGNKKRIPLGIYKIENRKLILREPIEYHRTLGGIDMGVSRYDIPTEFSGILLVFERIK